MPAVSADVLTLPRLARPAAGSRPRPVERVVTALRTFEGEGFPVRRPFPGVDLALADPFVLLDQMGEVDYAPGEAKGTSWHPHRGFETVTYMIDGVFEHQDTTGGGGVITDGATQWMTAGAGIQHIERPPEWLVTKGGLFHGVQLWVNLPASQKWVPPRYQGIEGDDVTLLTSHDAGGLVRLIAGELDGYQGPGATHTPIIYAHATVSPGAQLSLAWPRAFNALVYSLVGDGLAGDGLAGDGQAGEGRVPVHEGQLAVFGEGDTITVAAPEGGRPWEILLLGGRPIREPIARYGPFVMNTRSEITQAMEDYQAGRMGTVPASTLPHRSPADEQRTD
jgi:hypothetical protein